MTSKKSRLLEELVRREEQRTRWDAEKALFPPQRSFVQDTAPLVLGSCSRRAGKSFGCAWKVCDTGQRFPGCTIPYITQARENARDIIWPPLQQLNAEYDLRLEFNRNTGEVRSPEGWRLILRGAGSIREMEKLRGQKFPLVIIDEAQVFGPDLKYMIEEVLEPAMLDYGTDAQMYMIGTPNAAKAGPFWERIRSGKYPHHHWTVLDNPHIPDPRAFLEKKQREYGGKTAKYLREYEGQWVRDTEGMVFRINEHLNLVDGHNLSGIAGWTYVMGVDLGWRKTAFVVLAYHPEMERVEVVFAEEFANLVTAKIAARIEQHIKTWDLAGVAVDAGGFGRTMTEDLKVTYAIPVVHAEKREKAATVERMNSDLQAGIMSLCVEGCPEMIEQVRMLQWDSEKLVQNRMEFDDRFDDHMADAWLYGYRLCLHHGADWEETAPKHGSTEWYQSIEDREIERRMKKYVYRDEDEPWFAHEDVPLFPSF